MFHGACHVPYRITSFVGFLVRRKLLLMSQSERRHLTLNHLSTATYELKSNAACESDQETFVPYLPPNTFSGNNRKVYFDIHGCQMNVSDTELVWSILKKHGFQRTKSVQEADVVLIVTCAIRDGAEQKIWNKLTNLAALKKRRSSGKVLKIGVLGCMAERLKKLIIEKEQLVDLVAGPDSYRDLPRMLAVTESGQTAVNVLLSLDETYADILPFRLNENSKTAYVSVMRGCDNMCSYCIVPFTRGRERSRPVDSILQEVKALSDQGAKEVTLLGQNVNSYRDTSNGYQYPCTSTVTSKTSRGFSTIYRPKQGGIRFAELLSRVAEVDGEMRVRFTSPHPKDFADEVLTVIKETPNICKQIHLPAQSGNSTVLNAMRRGYTREAYVDLVHHIRSILPGFFLSSDFICGFCNETEEAHEDTLSLIRLVKYNFCYMFPFSLRKKTHAYHKLKDNVPQHVKVRRMQEVLDCFRQEAQKLNAQHIGSKQLVLIEGTSKRSRQDLFGRNDGGTKVIVPDVDVPLGVSTEGQKRLLPGDYVVVHVNSSTSQVLKATPLYHTTLQEFTRQAYCKDASYQAYMKSQMH